MLSIIMPVYNVEKYINKAVQSVLNQDGDFEIILVNDGSTDNSLHELRILEKMHQRIKVFDKENSGSGLTRNYGFGKSRGEYIYFMDPDDYLEKNFFSNIGHILMESKIEVLLFGNNIVNSEKVKLREKVGNLKKSYLVNRDIADDFEYLNSNYNMFSVWNKIYKRDFLMENNILFDNQKTGQDAIFNLKVLKFVNRMEVVPKCFYNYLELRPDSAQTKFKETKVLDNLAISREFRNLLDLWDIKNGFGDDFPISSVYLMINEANVVFKSYNEFNKKIDFVFNSENFKKSFRESVRFSKLTIKGKVKFILFKSKLYKGIWRLQKLI